MACSLAAPRPEICSSNRTGIRARYVDAEGQPRRMDGTLPDSERAAPRWGEAHGMAGSLLAAAPGWHMEAS